MKQLFFILACVFILPATVIAGPPTFDPETDCFTYEIIVGEGDHAGEMEMVGCPAETTTYAPFGSETKSRKNGASRSLLMTPDENGYFYFPIPENGKVDESITLFFTLSKEGEPPICHVLEDGKEVLAKPLFPVYDASGWVKQGKLTPFLNPEILPLLEVVKRKEGQLVGEGNVWSMLSQQRQVLGE